MVLLDLWSWWWTSGGAIGHVVLLVYLGGVGGLALVLVY